ncbi:glycoside hydrolase family 88/105 protein [Aestuariibaculum marinum]|uniref:Glycoside hydrolase family 88 protein n=1 Tax=Aestuariibaculum marinum TaxID=2683592 RepID=A0A8J6U633_9FLAO|nr:glycoside hydrolase family 88 protein [Aestuariibaculum marinum]MBD0825402.1 glycoside hydrolase family 88 protein [Aestuariibaculum marinum]
MKITKYYVKFVSFLLVVLVFYNCNYQIKNSQKLVKSGETNLCIDTNGITDVANKLASWQIQNFSYSETRNLHDNGIGAWTNATFYLGLLEWAKANDSNSNNKTYIDWLKNIGEKANWVVPGNFENYPQYQLYHADEFCIAQLYLGLYDLSKDEKILYSVLNRANWVINNPGNLNMHHSNKQSWTWSDALFMAPPVYTQLYAVEKDDKYLDFMDKEFKRTYDHLYSKKDSLFFRDDSYFSKTESNGEKVFWGRGNGWVASALVRILKQLPQDSEYRLFYEELFKEFVPKLVSLQDSSGFWHASLLDPNSYPAPEASATALIAYAIAYGINNDVLDKKTYCPILNKTWGALQSIVDKNGKLGWVQPIGANPKKVSSEMTATYGVGAFLLAGSEIYKMKQNLLK